jgi:hypothetical protein
MASRAKDVARWSGPQRRRGPQTRGSVEGCLQLRLEGRFGHHRSRRHADGEIDQTEVVVTEKEQTNSLRGAVVLEVRRLQDNDALLADHLGIQTENKDFI